MRLELTGRNVEITPTLRQMIERKLAKLDRLLNDSAVSAQVVLTIEKYRRVAEITIHARGDHMLHGIGQGSAWPMSLKVAIDKISQQAHRLKSKWKTRKRRAVGARRLSVLQRPPAGGGEGSADRKVIRAQRYPVKPMSIEDAALTVDTRHEGFLVFRNATTDTINILYRRKDGQLGLIEPEA